MDSGYSVGDAMTPEVICVKREETLQNCAKLMEKHKISALVVTDTKSRPLGIVTEKDLVRKGMIDDAKPSYLKVEDVMASNLITAKADEDIIDAIRTMRDYDIRHLPVIHNEKLSGIVTMKDLLNIQPELFETWLEKTTLGNIKGEGKHRR